MKEGKSTKDDIGIVEEIYELCKELTSMESHAEASFKSTGNEDWLKARDSARKLRTKYLSLIVKKDNGQGWCFSKHNCSASKRAEEVGTRFNSTSQFAEAKECYKDSEEIYFWFLKMNGFLEGNKEAVARTSA